MWAVSISLGLLVVIIALITLIVSAIRKKPLKRWGIAAIVIIALIIPSGCTETAPEFRASSLTITPEEIAVGESATVTVNVENVGKAEGAYHAALTVNEEVVEILDITLAAQEKQTISFIITEDVPGISNIELGGLKGTLNILKPLKPAEFRVVSLTTTPREIKVGESVRNTVIIENTGETEGTYHAVLVVNGEVKATKDIPLAAGEEKTTWFTGTKHPPGTYKVEMGGLVSTFKVVSPAEFRITSLTIMPEEILAGENSTITASVENVGEIEGIYHATLMVNGVEVETKDVPLTAGAKQAISFQLTEDIPDTYKIELGELAGTLKVLKRAEFRITSLTIMPEEILAGENSTVTASVENVGETEGTYHAALMVNGVEVETKDVPLTAGAKQAISFQLTEDMPDTYKIELGELAGTLKVLKPAEFEVVTHDITPNPAKVGEEIDVRIYVQNLGETEGTYVASLIVDGIVEETKEATLGGGVTESVSFTISRDSPGTYEIEVGSVKDVVRVIQPVRLPNGTLLVKELSGGWGELTIENGLDLDAVVILARSEEPEIPLLAVYVHSKDSYTITGIKDGTYVIYYTIGEDWDTDAKKFIGETEYKRFEDELHFETTGSTYTTYEATLHSVAGGTAGTEYLDEYEFPNLK